MVKYLRGRHTASLFLAFLTLALLLLLAWRIERWYEQQLQTEQQVRAAMELSARASALTGSINRRLTRLQGLNSFIQAEADSEAFSSEFDTYAAGLFAGSQGIRNIAVAPQGVMRYVYPLEGNETVLGYAPALDPRPEVRSDVQRTVVTGEIVLTGPVELLQGGLGVIARQAVYREGAYWGLVNFVLDVPMLLSEAGLDSPQQAQNLQPGALQYALRDETGHYFTGSPALFEGDYVEAEIHVANEQWQLIAAPRGGWSAATRRQLLIFRTAAVTISLLLVMLVYMVSDRQARLSRAVDRRTRELVEASRLLEARVEERTRELYGLLGISRSLNSRLELEPLLAELLEQLSSLVNNSSAMVLAYDEQEEEFAVLTQHTPFALNRFPQRWQVEPGTLEHQLVTERQWLIIDDVQAETPDALRWQAYYERINGRTPHALRSWMGVPLLLKEQVIGVLMVGHHEPYYFTQHRAELATAFASQAAVAIENARLYEQALSLAALQERQRLARELHDSVSQALYGIALGARTSRTLLDRAELTDEQTETLASPLDYVLSLAEAALTEMRALIFELRPESLAMEGLVVALTRQADALEARHGVAVTAEFGPEPEIPLSTKEALFRVAQEAMHNVVKHASAGRVSLSLLTEENGGHAAAEGQQALVLRVVDDGRGFNPTAAFPGHLGLRSIHERVEKIGGQITVESAPGQGTRIEVRLPLVDEGVRELEIG
jgi:signal transduction histidine kinase